MSLLVAIFYWVVIPLLVFLVARRLFRSANTRPQKGIIALATAPIFGGLLWVAAGEKWHLVPQRQGAS